MQLHDDGMLVEGEMQNGPKNTYQGKKGSFDENKEAMTSTVKAINGVNALESSTSTPPPH